MEIAGERDSFWYAGLEVNTARKKMAGIPILSFEGYVEAHGKIYRKAQVHFLLDASLLCVMRKG